jgi:hypothetical protein
MIWMVGLNRKATGRIADGDTIAVGSANPYRFATRPVASRKKLSTMTLAQAALLVIVRIVADAQKPSSHAVEQSAVSAELGEKISNVGRSGRAKEE